jgi:hypothetical protein
MHAQIPMHWNCNLDHTSGSNVSDESDHAEGRRGVDHVAVDKVLVCGGENCEDTVAKENGGDDGACEGDGGVCGPGHPQQGRGGLQVRLVWQTGGEIRVGGAGRRLIFRVCGFEGGKITFGPGVD